VSAGAPSVADILDDTGDVVARTAAPWVGVLWLTALPLRLVQAEIVSTVVGLGANAGSYGHLLASLAAVAAGAFVVATLGRAVYVRACVLAIRTAARPGTEALAVGTTAALTHLYLALLAETLFFLLSFTLVVPALAVTAAALASAVAPLADRPGPLRALRVLAAGARSGGALFGLHLVFVVAFVIAALNVLAAFHAGLWLASAVPGLELATWAHRFSSGNPRFPLLVLVGALLVVEPFWVAAHTVCVHRQRSRETGEDLRAWFERLRAPEAT
jgi:hypothetical protein